MGFFRGGKRVPGRFVLLCAASVATGTLLAGGPSAAQSRADAASDSVIVNMDALGDLAPYGTVSAGAASTVGLTGGDRRLLMPGPTPPGSEFHLGPPLTPPSAPRLTRPAPAELPMPAPRGTATADTSWQTPGAAVAPKPAAPRPVVPSVMAPKTEAPKPAAPKTMAPKAATPKTLAAKAPEPAKATPAPPPQPKMAEPPKAPEPKMVEPKMAEPPKAAMTPPPPPAQAQATTQAEPEPKAAPAPETAARTPASTPAGGDGVAAGQTRQVVFGDTETKLPDGDRKALTELATALQQKTDLRLLLMAYAGGGNLSPSTARRMSLSRALSVRSYLIDNGVHSTRIDVRALGNKTTKQPLNRVDVKVIER